MPRAAEKEVDDGPECRIVAPTITDGTRWNGILVKSFKVVAAPSFPAKRHGRQLKSRGGLDFCISRTLWPWILRQPYPTPTVLLTPFYTIYSSL